jgi:uncharacterized membrane protein
VNTVDGRLRVAAVALAVVGLGVATYLTIIHYNGAAPICGISHGCETVQHSEWSKLAGVPVALLGLIGYAGILVALFVPGEAGLIASAGQSLIGFGFSAYLTYREIWTIDAICIWCVSSAVLLTVLAVLTTWLMVVTPPTPSSSGSAA